MTNTSAAPKGFVEAFKFYTQRRLLSIFLLGMASGYPWVLIGSSMSAWLNESGMSRSAIGYFGAVFAMYSINFLWSPLVDRIRVPLLSAWLGHRRGWILFCQLGIALSCFALSGINFEQHSLVTAGLIALSIAIFSATQDIAIDAFRIDSIGEHEGHVQSAGAAMTTSGWWTAFAGIGSIPFFLSDFTGWSWSTIYQGLAVIMLLLSVGVWFAREPKTNRAEQQRETELFYRQVAANKPQVTATMPIIGVALFVAIAYAFSGMENAGLAGWLLWVGVVIVLLGLLIRVLIRLQSQAPTTQNSGSSRPLPIRTGHKITAWLIVTMIEPLAEFFRRNGVRFALSMLLFVLLFKIGEAFLGRMSIVFYQEVGFTNAQIGLYSKLVNWWVTILFSLIGSYVTMRSGIVKGLFIGGSAMAASNLLFSALALTGPSVPLLLAAVITDGFTSAWSTVAFVALISLLANRAFTASQYALMASIATLGRTVLGSYSGALVDFLNGNWSLFFLLTTLMVIPSLLFLWTIRKSIAKLEHDNRERFRT
ncbi:AmpG family muropeptide MFS transporter [Aliidiomarina celeris]|uniref:AmpG family muropeptide MFS transporter n=1 Tax=Aliidiomarina celeris TaxID=2249428 RepID=UPI000DE8B4A9|nr:MFS transporter [Aliidiomarina celeris]